MTVNLTAAQARKMGIDLSTARKAKVVRKRTTQRVVKGEAYHTVCVTCQAEFHVMAAEDRHVEETKHTNYRLVLGH